MDNDPHTDHPEAAGAGMTDPARKLEAAGWGIALVWIGFATLVGIGWPIVLIGLGALTLALQALRMYSGLKPEGFWLVLGAVLLVAGLWDLATDVAFPIVPVALILFGLALLARVFGRAGFGGR